HLSSGPGRRRPAGGGTRRPPRVVQGRTRSGTTPDPCRTRHCPSAIHYSAECRGERSPRRRVTTNRGSLSPPAEWLPRDGEGAGAIEDPDQRILLGTEPDEVAVVDPDPLEELDLGDDAGPK